MLYENYEYLKKRALNFYNFYRKMAEQRSNDLFELDKDNRISFVSNPDTKLSSRYEEYQNDLIVNHIMEMTANEIIVIGIGNLSLLEKLSRIKNKKIHLVEFFELFNLMMNEFDMRKVDFSNFSTFTLMYKELTLKSIQQNLLKSSNFDVDFFILPQYKRFFNKEVKAFYSDFRNTVENKKSLTKVNLAFEKRWIINSIKNFKSITRTENIFDLPRGAFNNSVALIASAGPSLSYELENLKTEAVREHTYVFAMGSANKALLSAGIRPDGIFSYDPSKENANVLDIYREQASAPPLIFSSTIGNESLKELDLNNCYHFILSQDTLYKHFAGNVEQGRIIHDSPSVAVIGLQVLLKLGFKKIIFVGQNLALMNGKSYSAEIKHKHYVDGKMKSDQSVENVHSEMVETTTSYSRMRRSIEQLIKQCPNVEFVNTTRQGARIEGAPYVPFETILDSLTQFEKRIDLDVEGFDKTLDIKRVGKNIDKLLKLREQFFVEVTKSEDRLRAFAKDINSVNKSEVKKYPQKLQEDLRLLEKNIYCKDFLAVMLRTYLSIFKSELFSIVQREETMGKYVVIYEKFNTVYTYFRAYDKLMYKELVKLKTELEEEVQI